ncbi:MAG TPA: hypothetical protein VGA56_11515 [Opitutaceae bacterium]
MDITETGGPGFITIGLGAITMLTAVPMSIVFTIAAFLGIRRSKVDAYVEQALDQYLAADAKALRKRAVRKVLDFRTSDSISAALFGLGLGRVKVYRTILGSLRDGYRVRLRAFAEGARGRVIVRTLDIDLLGKR